MKNAIWKSRDTKNCEPLLKDLGKVETSTLLSFYHEIVELSLVGYNPGGYTRQTVKDPDSYRGVRRLIIDYDEE